MNETMIRGLTGFAGLAAILLLMPGVLHGDYCLADGAYILVGRGFTIPGKGKCKAFIGFQAGDANAPTTGTACTSSDGTTLSFTLSTSYPLRGIEWTQDSLTFTSSSPDGTDEFAGFFDGSVFEAYAAPFVRGSCSGKTIPAVREEEGAPAVPPPLP